MLILGQKKQNDLDLIGMTLIINYNSNPRIQFPITENAVMPHLLTLFNYY